MIVGACVVITTAMLVRILYTRIRASILTAPPARRIAVLFGLAVAPLAAGSVLALLTGISSFDYIADFIKHHCHVANLENACLPHVQLQLAPLVEFLAILIAMGLTVALLATPLRHVAEWDRIKKFLCAAGRYSEKFDAHLIDDDRPLALCAGVLNPMVFISKGLMRHLTLEEIRIVLAHEQAHARRLDGLLQAVARCLLVWHLPSMKRLLLNDLALAIEQACDDEAARRTTGRLAVAETILKVERLHHQQWEYLSSVNAIVGSSVTARIEYLLHESAPFERKWMTKLIIHAAIYAAALIVSAEPFHHIIETVTLSLIG
tara:strand:+ start:961 stop:1917 length:957 start_codon:yes stop_codon:yes gene_type:complete